MRRLALLLVLAACTPKGSKQGGVSDTSEGDPKRHDEASKPPPCRPPELASATRLDRWTPPAGCRWALTNERPTFVRSDTELRTILACEDAGAGATGIDFDRTTLVVTEKHLGPATVAIDAYDDGKDVVFVSRQRFPKDPKRAVKPHPITLPFAFVLEGKTERGYAEARCTQEP